MPKQKMVCIRVTDEEMKLIKQRANLKRMTVSQLFLMLFYRDCD